MTTPFTGYPGQVWRTAYQALTWLSGIMAASGNNPATVADPALAVYQTLRNAVDAISAFGIAAAWNSEIAAFQTIQVLPLTLDTGTAAFFNARVSCMMAAAPAMAALVPPISPANTVALLTAGQPAVRDPGLLDFYAGFGFESPPVDLETATLAASAQAAAAAWQTVANAISVLQGAVLTSAYDTALRQFYASQKAADTIAAFVSGPVLGVPTFVLDSQDFTVVDSNGDPVMTGNSDSAWNALVAMPALQADAAILTSAPFNVANQQSGVIRYTLINAANQLAFLLLSLRQPTAGITNLATLYNNDTLLDFAARNTGDFENWTSVAAANALQPPWAGPGGAPYGSQLFVPSPGSAPPTPGVAQPTYAANVLGTDVYVGPINGSMPPWTGDYQLVTGYANLAISLGRRLQTPLGALLYHRDFGSRIPPEVGNVQDSSTAGHIAAYGQSALLSDPRTGSVLNAQATIQPGGLGLVAFSATVQPIGQGATALDVNQVISPIV